MGGTLRGVECVARSQSRRGGGFAHTNLLCGARFRLPRCPRIRSRPRAKASGGAAASRGTERLRVHTEDLSLPLSPHCLGLCWGLPLADSQNRCSCEWLECCEE